MNIFTIKKHNISFGHKYLIYIIIIAFMFIAALLLSSRVYDTRFTLGNYNHLHLNYPRGKFVQVMKELVVDKITLERDSIDYRIHLKTTIDVEMGVYCPGDPLPAIRTYDAYHTDPVLKVNGIINF